jgi:hypothetical protein
MQWNYHPIGEHQHAFLSPSKYHWVNYDISKLDEVYGRFQAARKGTELHEFASNAIRLGIRLPRSNKTLNLYVNDAIGFKMTPEVALLYSENAFGTADAIAFRNGVLRIHDLKTGVSRVSMTQLEVYAALFCLEYEQDPLNIECELRIYQTDEVLVYIPDPVDILAIMEKIEFFDKRIRELDKEL